MTEDELKKKTTEEVTELILKQIEKRFHEFLTPETKIKVAASIYIYLDGKQEALEAALLSFFSQRVLVGFDIWEENKGKVREMMLAGLKPDSERIQ